MKADDERVGQTLLYEATRTAGGDRAATGGNRGAELDPVITPLFPLNGPVAGVYMEHNGVAAAEEERLEERKKGFGGERIKRHEGFLPLAYGDGGPLVKMPKLSSATRSAMRPSTKRPVSSMKAEFPPVVKQPLVWSWIRMVRADWAARRVD